MGLFGSFRLGKGLISGMHLGGFKVDFESALFGLELTCTSFTSFLQQLLGCFGAWLRKFWAGLGLVVG